MKSKLFPATFYPKEDVELILELDRRGFPQDQIVEELIELYRDTWPEGTRINDKRRTYGNRIRTILADKWNWWPHESQVAIELAFLGNAGAWQELNYYERKTLVLRLQAMVDNGTTHPRWPDMAFSKGGLAAWAESVGMETTQYVLTSLGRRNS